MANETNFDQQEKNLFDIEKKTDLLVAELNV